MKVISAVAGLVLIGSASLLAYLSSSNASEMIAKKDAIVERYVSKSTDALKNNKFGVAIQNAKLAIATDPKSKKGFKAYESVMKIKYKPASSDTPSVAPVTKKPAPVEEAMPDMGC